MCREAWAVECVMFDRMAVAGQELGAGPNLSLLLN